VIPALQPGQLSKFAAGELKPDALTRDYINTHLEYQFAVLDSSAAAFALEKECRTGVTFGTKPLLNPA
jgi:hypothetical protein